MKMIFKLKKLNKWLVNIIDMGLFVLVFYSSFMLKFDFNPPSKNFEPFIRLIPLIILFAFVYVNIYDLTEIRKKRMVDLGISIFLSLMMLHITTMALTFVFRGFAFPRSIFLISFILQFVLLILWKAILLKFTKNL